jgi:hypothetical protein
MRIEDDNPVTLWRLRIFMDLQSDLYHQHKNSESRHTRIEDDNADIHFLQSAMQFYWFAEWFISATSE